MTPSRRYREHVFREAERCGREVVCAYCKTPLTLETSTVDHRVPRTRGGSGERENLTIACQPCNLAKGKKVKLADALLLPLNVFAPMSRCIVGERLGPMKIDIMPERRGAKFQCWPRERYAGLCRAGRRYRSRR